jgi:hypothetical protein
MKEKESIEFWNEFVDRDIYRVTSEEYLQDMTERGLDPSNDPFQELYKDMDSLFELMVKYEEKGIVYQEVWRDGPVTASHIIEFNRDSRTNSYLDFVADYRQALKFYGKWRGGALTNVIFNFTDFLQNQELSLLEKQLVGKLHEVSSEKRIHKNRIVAVKGSNTVFDDAKMLCLPKKGERFTLPSPYGSFEHFKQVSRGKLDAYLPFLKIEELSYLRVSGKVPAGAIKIIL